MDQPTQIHLFDEPTDGADRVELQRWPAQDRFPLNVAGEKVGNTARRN
jgi:hypothetical protein